MQNDASTLLLLGEITLSKLAEYLSESQSGKHSVLQQPSPQQLAEDLNLETIIRQGNMDISAFLDQYLPHTQHLHHPHYMGHQVATPHVASSMSDFIHGVINNPMAIYEMGPAAAVIERIIINWMLEKIGWFSGSRLADFTSQNGAGVLTHGGSLATLTALLAARAQIAPEAWDLGTPNDLVVLAPSNSHYAVARAISIMGLGKKAHIPLKTNDLEQIIPGELAKTIVNIKAQGKRILAVVANACATSTGLYDPLDEIGQICEHHHLWFHVDGAHGASALISDKEKHFLKGIERAHSVIWDAHKMLQTSSLCAAVLFKDAALMTATFQQKASYLLHEKEDKGLDAMPYAIECTKAALGTKLFWNLAVVGEQKMATFIENRQTITRDFHDLLQQHPAFEIPYYPQSNILCFRYTKGDLSNDFQLKLRNKIVMKGQFYITTTEIKNRRYLRVVLMNEQTEMSHLTALVNEIVNVAQQITGQ